MMDCVPQTMNPLFKMRPYTIINWVSSMMTHLIFRPLTEPNINRCGPERNELEGTVSSEAPGQEYVQIAHKEEKKSYRTRVMLALRLLSQWQSSHNSSYALSYFFGAYSSWVPARGSPTTWLTTHTPTFICHESLRKHILRWTWIGCWLTICLIFICYPDKR